MSVRLKVGIDLSPIGFRSRAPGTAVHVENQARALLAMPVEWDWVVVATPRVLSDSPYFRSFSPIVVKDSPLSYHVSWRLGRVWAASGCILGLATAFFAPLTGPAVVTNYFDANAFDPACRFTDPRKRMISLVVQALWRVSRRRSRALFILSHYGRRRMMEIDPAVGSKWVVTPCGCAPLPERPSQTPNWATTLQGHSFILFAGDFSENKNQRRLIEAWIQLRLQDESFPRLVLVGPCPASYLRDVVAPACAKAPNPDEIILTGFIPAEEVVWAFRSAFAYVQPSFAEGFGMPVVEAMSCGLPVACSNSTSLPEVAGGAALLFDPTRVDSIVAALKTLVYDPVERERLRRAGLERSKIFTWEAHASIVTERIREELAKIPPEGRDDA